MSVSPFFNNATNISIEHLTAIAQITSQSGVRQSQRRSPVFYRIKVKYPTMVNNGDDHKALRNLILTNQYGNLTFTSKLPTKWNLIQKDGTFLANGTNVPRPYDVPNVATDTLYGYNINVTNYMAGETNLGAIGDYIQFSGWAKVLQLTRIAKTATNSNHSIFYVNSAIPMGAISTTNTIRTGNDVIFNLMVEKRPEPTFLSGNLVQYSDAVFREVL